MLSEYYAEDYYDRQLAFTGGMQYYKSAWIGIIILPISGAKE